MMRHMGPMLLPLCAMRPGGRLMRLVVGVTGALPRADGLAWRRDDWSPGHRTVEPPVAVGPHLATVTLAPEQALPPGVVISANLIQVELAAYIGDFRDSAFSWEVTEMAPLIFLVPFPSAELLRLCSHDLIRYPINNILISIHAAAAEPDPVSPLEKVWVLVYGLPRGGRSASRGGKLADILKAISEPVGKRVTADLPSFEDDGPVRIGIL
ncbi:hypothetical protein ZWY2020_029210 [Hordeum vulgare]|nr:hypothetical protein ZWY2020_029210 [Hordeum vulgare]